MPPPHRSCHIFSPIVQETRGACDETGMMRPSGSCPAISRTSFDKFFALPDRNNKSARATDDAILVINVELINI